MKYLYFGTICNKENYERMRDGFSVKPTMAPFVFETALLKGFHENGAQLQVVSFPAIPAFPKCKHLLWGGRRETLESGYATQWIPAINIVGIKQLCRRYASGRILKKWLEENAKEEKVVLMYSAYQPIAKSIVTICKKYNTKCYAIIPDLPRDMFALSHIHPLKKTAARLFVREAEKVQGRFDGYIYLTDAMKEVINPTAPYVVVEGIANAAEAVKLLPQDKAPGKVIMYAGTLHERFGLRNLLEAFTQITIPDAQLWLFGTGDFEKEIREYAIKDGRIHYFGSVSRSEVLQYEKQATLLVNVRSENDAYTRYSFPSKVIEYMLSGTPMLMTKLPGISEEYYHYTFAVDNNDIDTLRVAMEQILDKQKEELIDFGARAQAFVANEKNSRVQASKIMSLIGR